MPEEAIVDYEDDWPWCPYAERKAKFWPKHLVRPALPHDNHRVNEGNTWCPGHPGLIEEDE